MQQPLRDGTWIGSAFVVSKFNGIEIFQSEWLHLVDPQTQQPPSSGTWVGSTCEISKSIFKCEVGIHGFERRQQYRVTKQRRGYMPKRPPQIVAQEGNYETIELFSKVLQNSSKMALSHTTGRVSRCLKPTVWTVERSVSGVLHVSSLPRSLKLSKRKGISDREF
ncbi:hypothetical protein V1477_013707 [Vespula maculifrons]|uniref:Uncharacterized protein n=1 Tax=Vespula maculifrons TaxID=7453 RepID=A0ABD2BPM5_VESMC